MNNLDIMSITASYVNHKNEVAKAKQAGEAVHELALPAKVSWKRRLNMKKLLSARSTIEEALSEIDSIYMDDEHSKKDESGNKVINPEFREEYIKKRMEIFEQDTEIDLAKIKIGELEGIDVTDEEMDTLLFMIEEE